MSPARKNDSSDSVNEIATVRIELRDSDPLIWRRVEVPTSVTLKILHDIIQAVMGWSDYHLWEFTIGKQKYGLPVDENWGTKPRLEASKVRLRDVLKPRKTGIDYTYDFGDCWEHRLTVTDVRAGQPGVSYPRYIGGEWNAPPEDCGGIPGFYAMLEASADPTHPNHAEAKEWADDYDPQVIDELPIKYALGRIANRRNAALARPGKKKQGGSEITT
jgi:Plasmid pRiA4b ORF-3-like protein